MKKKSRIWVCLLIVMVLALILINSCKKKEDSGNKITDGDGNIYTTVTIGTQVWMAENLKTTKYNDGTSIPNITENPDWNNLTTPGYSWYLNDETQYKNRYGAYYNWYTVNTAILCPTGWHVPNDTEWEILALYLGGTSIAGGKLKETGTVWENPDNGVTNETGFTALPCGYRWENGEFLDVGLNGNWWSATENLSQDAWYLYMVLENNAVYRNITNRKNGFSVRCLKDN